jgi:hypothetical protein
MVGGDYPMLRLGAKKNSAGGRIPAELYTASSLFTSSTHQPPGLFSRPHIIIITILPSDFVSSGRHRY